MSKDVLATKISVLLQRYYVSHDEQALADFFTQMHGLMYRVAYSVVGNQADADDVVQRSFVTIIQKANLCQAANDGNDEKVRSWVLSIVYNYGRMSLRSKKITQTIELKEGEDMSYQSKDDLRRQQNALENSKVLDQALFQLPEKYRVPILMRYREDMSLEEIALALEVKASTLRSIISRGLVMLREQMGKEQIVLSGEAAILLLKSFSYPPSKGKVSVSLIREIATAKTASAKIAVSVVPKSMIYSYAWWVIIACMALGGLGYWVKNEKRVEITKERVTNKVVAKQTTEVNEASAMIKTHYDFSKGDHKNIKVLNGSIGYLENKGVIFNQATGSTIIKLDYKIKNNIRIYARGYMKLTDFTKANPILNTMLDFVATENNQIKSGCNLLYKSKEPLNLPGIQEIPYEQEIFIIDEWAIKVAGSHGLQNVMQFEKLQQGTEIGLALLGIYIKEIIIENLDDEKAKKILSNTKNKLTPEEKMEIKKYPFDGLR